MFDSAYQTGADASYFWHGANRWNHADTDAFGGLPLWEMHTVVANVCLRLDTRPPADEWDALGW